MKELSKKNKFRLLKKLRTYVQTVRLLIAALILTLTFTVLSYKFKWVSGDFPAYPALLSLVISGAILVYYYQIINTRKAILSSKKTVITGAIQKKTSQYDEYSTEYAFEIAGNRYDVKAKDFEAFQEGEQVKIELTEPGRDLIKVKRVKEV
jgi:hypothetical protein